MSVTSRDAYTIEGLTKFLYIDISCEEKKLAETIQKC